MDESTTGPTPEGPEGLNVSGQSLFPDEYPTGPPPFRRAHRMCCAEEHAHPTHDARLWHFAHVLGHTRIPFSASTMAAMADVELDEAYAAILDAVDVGWLRQTPPEVYESGPIQTWFGCLAKRN
jgi:hypothetical protein